MAFARVYTAQNTGLTGHIVTVEVDTARGLNAFSIVGLPDQSVEEAKDRVGSALKNSGFESPKTKNQKTIISLLPADMKKEGSQFDLALAIGYLTVEEIIQTPLNKTLFIGELSLSGNLEPVKGILSLVKAARDNGFTTIFLPEANALEGSLVDDIDVYGVKTLEEIVGHLRGKVSLTKTESLVWKNGFENYRDSDIGFETIRGQEGAKRALIIAAAGGHNSALFGPPGTGKTLLARALQGVLPPLTKEEALEVTGIHSIVGGVDHSIITSRPFRAPHHTASYVSVIGGGTTPKPGEVTLAHRGVLFLDEFPEFDKRVIESLRQPLEDRIVHIARARGSTIFPADFMLIAAFNPCPCGYRGTNVRECRCTPGDLARYERKLSGPIVDRIDIWTSVSHIPHESLLAPAEITQTSKDIREKIFQARTFAEQRYQLLKKPYKTNADVSAKDIPGVLFLSPETTKLIETHAARLSLSARSLHRVLRVARTIADLANEKTVLPKHMLEALQYRPKVER